MSSSQLSTAIVAFAESNIGSVDELMVLLALAESTRWWDSAMVARHMGLPAAVAGRILDRLASRNLLDIRVTDDVRYQFHPATAELTQAVMDFVDAYRRYPTEMIQIVMRKSTNRSARDFADAFKIRRDESG